MKIHISVLFCMLFAMGMYAQGDSIVFAEMPNGTPLKAGYMDLEGQGYALSFSPDGYLLGVRVCDKGGNNGNEWKLCMYDAHTRQMLWERATGFPAPNIFFSMVNCGSMSLMDEGVYEDKSMVWTQQGLLLVEGNTLKMIDPRTQQEKWKGRLALLLVDDTLDIAVGYKNNISNKLCALRLSTGEKLWELKVPYDKSWGWDNVKRVDKTSLLVVNNDISLINLVTGKRKIHRVRTGYVEVGKALAQSFALGLTGGIVGGMTGYAVYYVPGAGNYMVTRLNSNIYQKGEHYYVSDRDSLFCFDKYLHTVWSYGFDRKALGAAQLFSKGDTLYLFNKGYGVRGNGSKKLLGIPSLSSFDVTTGKLYRTMCYTAEKKLLQDDAVSPEGMFLVFEDTLTYQTPGNNEVCMQAWNMQAYGRVGMVLHDTVYAIGANDEAFIPLCSSENSYVVGTDKGKVFRVNGDLKITNDYLAHHFYRVCQRYGDYCFVRNIEKKVQDFRLIRSTGEKIGHVTLKVQAAEMHDGVLFLLCDSNLIFINTRRF